MSVLAAWKPHNTRFNGQETPDGCNQADFSCFFSEKSQKIQKTQNHDSFSEFLFFFARALQSMLLSNLLLCLRLVDAVDGELRAQRPLRITELENAVDGATPRLRPWYLPIHGFHPGQRGSVSPPTPLIFLWTRFRVAIDVTGTIIQTKYRQAWEIIFSHLCQSFHFCVSCGGHGVCCACPAFSCLRLDGPPERGCTTHQHRPDRVLQLIFQQMRPACRGVKCLEMCCFLQTWRRVSYKKHNTKPTRRRTGRCAWRCII